MARLAEPGWLAIVALAAGIGTALVNATGQSPTQPPTFRTATEAVWVTATAIDRDGRLVTDLGRDDFEVLVDGVSQPINQFRTDEVPFALSIMFDLSGSLGESVGAMRRAMVELIDRFRPGDRANVGSFDTLPTISPRFSGHRETLLRSTAALLNSPGLVCSGPWMTESWKMRVRGMSAIWDAVACGVDTVAGDAETPRRVVLIITDGFENVSATTQADAQALANTYGVMVYAIGMIGSQGVNSAALRGLAAETGGGYFLLNRQDDMAPTFARVAEELRRQYVLGYSGPAGAAQRGKLEIRVKRPGVIARGRRATMTVLPVTTAVTEAVAVERSRIPAAAPVMPASESVFDRSARNALRPNDLPRLPLPALRTVALEMRTAGTAWIRAAGLAQEPIRRLQLATFVLEFLSVQDNFQYWQNYDAAPNLFDWASALVRTGPPRPAERLWHQAGAALLQRFGASWLLEIHLRYARGRFPGEPRFLLARAVSVEMQLWPQRRDELGFVVPDDMLVRIRARYEDAIGNAAVRQEAHLRLGYVELLRGRTAEALTHFDQVGAPDDRMLRYMHHLLRGKALTAAQRHDDAIESFRRAFDEVPYAQSATLALGAALVTRGRHNEAADLTTRMLALPTPPFDPWTIYTMPEWRYWEPLMNSLRRAGGS